MDTFVLKLTPAGSAALPLHDVTNGMVVAAPTPHQARKAAQDHTRDMTAFRDDGKVAIAASAPKEPIWTTAVYATCERLGTYGGRKQVPFVVMRDFNAG